VIRLEPMSEAEFQTSLERAIVRHAEYRTAAGTWTAERALEVSRAEFAELLPDGRGTPDHQFCHVVDDRNGRVVGETWYRAQERGGRLQFWVDWVWIDPAHRRRGYATRLLLLLAAKAEKLGAIHLGLSVVADNTNAIGLYSKLGFRVTRMQMTKRLGEPSNPPEKKPRAGRK
jgi:ribosomal protein S18 acetylase RimI-like enzyme